MPLWAMACMFFTPFFTVVYIVEWLVNSVSKRKWQRYEMAILQVFPAIFSPTTLIAFTKLRFWRSFWRAQHVKILIGSKAMTQITIFVLSFYFQFCKKKIGNIQLKNGYIMTNFGHCFGKYINIFKKIEIQTIILSCLVSQNLN
jgi:hypothetical protein